MNGVTCASCGKRDREMRYVGGQILCVTHAGPPTVDNPNCGPRVCFTCGDPVHPRSGELQCEPCLYAARVSS